MLASSAANSLPTSFMRFVRHVLRLFSDLFGFARKNKVWWIVPLVITLLVIALLIVGVSTISPFIYSLF